MAARTKVQYTEHRCAFPFKWPQSKGRIDYIDHSTIYFHVFIITLIGCKKSVKNLYFNIFQLVEKIMLDIQIVHTTIPVITSQVGWLSVGHHWWLWKGF